MSLVRFLPTPSDRMGIIWSLLAVQRAIVLEYGPAGTTHYSMGLYGGLGLRFQNRLFTTHMSEDDVVMGDVTRLEEAIIELDKSYAPKVIFVVASSVTAVIGTDIKGVCRYMQNEVKAKLVAFEQGGFRGDYSVGLAETYKLAYHYVHKNFMHKTVHAGEAYGPESIFQAITDLHADRIGHGYHLFSPELCGPSVKDPQQYIERLIRHIADSRTTIEVCITSNMQTNPAIGDVKNHAFGKMLANNLSEPPSRLSD